MPVIKMTIIGEDRFIYRMRAVAAAVAAPMHGLEEVATDMMRVIRATFTGQGRRGGGSWHALDKATIRNKARKGQDPRILIATSALMNSYTRRGDSHQQLSVTPSGITLDSTLTYGEVHQLGEGVPKREFIKFYPNDKARWKRMIEADLHAAYRGVRR